jgi:hypothetical protein
MFLDLNMFRKWLSDDFFLSFFFLFSLSLSLSLLSVVARNPRREFGPIGVRFSSSNCRRGKKEEGSCRNGYVKVDNKSRDILLAPWTISAVAILHGHFPIECQRTKVAA